jgi:hypothetical protein
VRPWRVRDHDGAFRLTAIREGSGDVIGRTDLGEPQRLSREDPESIARHGQRGREIVGQGHWGQTPISKLRSAAGAECVNPPIET